MLQLIYHSVAAPGVTPEDLQALIATSRRKNLERDISGILVFNGTAFLQVLEGPEEAVVDLMGYIHRDLRHTDVRVLAETIVAEREFGDWAMVLAETEDQEALGDYGDFSLSGSVAHQILSMFHTGMLEQTSASMGGGSFSLHLGSEKPSAPMFSARSSQDYLITLGRALALSLPETAVSVRMDGTSEVSFNKRGTLESGGIELF